MVSIFCFSAASLILSVAEGEASLHFCLHSGRSFPTWLCSASPDFIAANQEARVDNVIHGGDTQAHLEDIRAGIRKLISERYSDTIHSFARRGLHSFFAVTAILEGEPFVNCAPQNTFVPGTVEFAEREKSFIGGDELDSSSPIPRRHQCRSPRCRLIQPCRHQRWPQLIPERQPPGVNDKGTLKDKGEHPDDHVVVIQYVPAVGDSKRAINEYLPEIFCGGRSVIKIFNECKDSLLATPLILDLSILAELLTRVKYCKVGETKFKPLHSVLSLLSYMLKAPLVKPGMSIPLFLPFWDAG
ncbi:NAD(P)-binding protein [Coprinopsis marcescibilis]|uniref:inositol-3-phosphate synthase n=1 Tax=Coprinopsis marcescibilis TaxID=230819 RepID=A0A5C3KB20_COPMA|nr:NAD(P)-binding protein [Coprinopsis marcescibilis]